MVYYMVGAIFLGIIVTSVIFTIRLLFPIRVAYLEVSDRYSTNLRSEYERKFLPSDLSEEKAKEAKHKIDNYLKASYIAELSEAQEINQRVFVSKSSFYYRALVYGLAAIIPYVICIGFHLSRKDDKIQKVHIAYYQVIYMPKNNSNNGTPRNSNTGSSTTTVVTTQVPGVDMTQVIASPPHLVKENSAKIDVKAIDESHRK
jgi:hypothetical protein